MKKIISYILVVLAICAGSHSAKAEPFFQLPIVPDTMAFENRVNYLVEHYWDFCDLKKAFSSRQRMAEAFKEYLDLMPLVKEETAMRSVQKFIAGIDKPDNLLFITRTAEEYMHSDTAVVISDYLYLPFAKAVASNRKIDKADKMRYEHQARVISNSMVGNAMPDFTYIDRTGAQRHLAADSAMVVLIYIYDTDCSDCAMARIRLDADINTNKLIDAGRMKIVALSPTTPDGQWRDIVSSYPANWTVGAKEDLDETIEITSAPAFYLLDNNHIIFGKNMPLEAVLEVNRQLAARTPDPYMREIQRKARQKAETAAEK